MLGGGHSPTPVFLRKDVIRLGLLARVDAKQLKDLFLKDLNSL
jgi:hypothetical protein